MKKSSVPLPNIDTSELFYGAVFTEILTFTAYIFIEGYLRKTWDYLNKIVVEFLSRIILTSCKFLWKVVVL
jgi:hypothetical protein